MDWLTATLRLSPSRCPTAPQLGADQVFECLRPGAQAEPAGYVDGTSPDGWDRVAPTGHGTLVRCPGISCEDCPLADLPGETLLLRGRVRRGSVEADIAVPSREAFATTVDVLRARGFTTQVARVSPRARHDARRVLVDLGRLTPRQLQALRTAAAWGFFTPGGNVTLDDLTRVMQLSRSTLHEHLQKGLAALVEEAVGPAGTNGTRRNGDE